MKKRKNTSTMIGLDGFDIVVATPNTIRGDKDIKLYYGNKAVEAGRITPVSGGWKLHICLPKMIRSNNVAPFGRADREQISSVLADLSEILKERLGVSLEKAHVKTVEVNMTAKLQNPEQVNGIMNLFALMLLENTGKVFVTARGVKDHLYKNVALDRNILRRVAQVESIKIPRIGNKKLSFRLYDKGMEQGKPEESLLRIEQIVNSFGLQCEQVPTRLDCFLSYSVICQLIGLFKHNFQNNFLNLYWTKGSDSFPVTCVNTILQEFDEGERPLTVAKIHRQLISIDFGFFERACFAYYDNKKSAQQAIRRVKDSGKIKIVHGTIAELVKVFRAILAY